MTLPFGSSGARASAHPQPWLCRGILARLALALLGLCALVSPARAYQVAPMIYDLKPSGTGAATMLRIRNDGDKPLTIELEAQTRQFDENGVEKRENADDAFVIFPLQAVIPPGKVQAVRVQYIGPSDIPASRTYLVTVKQVPVTLPTEQQSGIQMVFNFATMANIVPDGAKPDVSIDPVGHDDKGLVLRIHNRGTSYANLGSASVAIDGKAIDADIWRKALHSVWLMPGQDRVVHLDGPAGASSATIRLIDATS